MTTGENPIKVEFSIEVEYYESEVTSSFDPKTHLLNTVSDRISTAILEDYLENLPEGLIPDDVAASLKSHSADIVRIKQLKENVQPLNVEPEDRETEPVFRVTLAVELEVDSRLDVYEEYLEGAAQKLFEDYGPKLEYGKIEKPQSLLIRKQFAGEFSNFVINLDDALEPNQIKFCVAAEHKLTKPPVSLDVFFDQIDRFPDFEIDALAHYAFVATELKNMVEQFKPDLTKTLKVGTVAPAEKEPLPPIQNRSTRIL